jgi:hypothetical protein
MSHAINRDRFAKVLALMSSPVDGEALAATRTAVKMLANINLRPEDLVNGIPKPDEPIGFETIVRYKWSYGTEPPQRPPPPKPTHERRPNPPPQPTFRDLGPASARRVIADILAAGNLSARNVAFFGEISARLYSEPHIGLSTGEVQRLNKLWRSMPSREATA